VVASVQIAMLNKRFKEILRLNKGLTLIETLIALVVTLVLFMALMQSALLSIGINTGNVLRDEAVRIAEERMTELRNLPFNHADLVQTGGFVDEGDILRNVRNIQNHPFNQQRRIIDLPAGSPTAKQVEMLITWEWKEKTVASGNPYTHSISTIVRRQ